MHDLRAQHIVNVTRPIMRPADSVAFGVFSTATPKGCPSRPLPWLCRSGCVDVMPRIELQTSIRAPRELVFDLARSIDAHQASTTGTSERAVAGVTAGLIGLGQSVTWEARHFGIRQRLTVEIVGYDRPARFRDVMRRGAFAAMSHEHRFDEASGRTIMRDTFEFRAPLGPLGWLAERLFLTRYMTRFLRQRADALRIMAESDAWQKFLA